MGTSGANVIPVIAMAVGSLLLAVVALLLLVVVAYKRRSKQQASSVANAKPRQSVVSWQAGRWDTDRRHAYVANLGNDVAYEVSVTAYDRVIGTAQSVPPFRAGRLSSTSEVPCYVNFCFDQRLAQGAFRGTEGVSQIALDKAVDPDRSEFVVQVSWRSERGVRFTQTAGPIDLTCSLFPPP
ncbi:MULTISPECIES: hypothetical protein [unclassified Mycobacterium]|uniref:hypothetical protein n=1 Tax=unclassified Mycobacterium TaxID=2642494 RepID=UPI0029C658E7|nr:MULTISPECIES: hypothetical protein [unclassified Mycobacterium]